MPMPWFRVYSELLNDRKMARIARTATLPKALVIGVWTSLLCLASDSPERGRLLIAPNMPYTDFELALEIGLDEGQFETILKSLTDLGMIRLDEENCWRITKWDCRQFVSDDSTKRWRQWKQRQEDAQIVKDDPEVTNVDPTFATSGAIPSVSVSSSDSILGSESESFPEIEQMRSKSAPNLPMTMQTDTTPAPIRVYREIRRWCPPPGSPPWQLMAELPNDKASLEKWRQVIAAWWNLDFNGRNIAGQVEWFHNGIPPSGSPREVRAKMDFEATKKEDAERLQRKVADYEAMHGITRKDQP